MLSKKKNSLSGNRIVWFVALHCLIIFNSISGVLSKVSSNYKFLSFKFCLTYLGIILILALYAICWQQIIKHIPLTTAFCNKSVSIIWGMVWGSVLFKEVITYKMIVGGIIVIVGVIMVVISDE